MDFSGIFYFILTMGLTAEETDKTGIWFGNTGELGYDGLNGTRKIGPSYAKIRRTVVRHIQVHLYNPSNAQATFTQSTGSKYFLKTI